jgi:hypothetical protein
MGLTVGVEGQGRVSELVVDPILTMPRLAEQDLEVAVKVEERPIVGRQVHEHWQVGRPEDAHLAGSGHCPGARQQMFDHSAKAEGEP